MSSTRDDYYNLAERIEGSFSEIDSDICMDLRERDAEYQEMEREADALEESCPVITEIMDGEGSVSLTGEEHDALTRYLHLKHVMENSERKQIYFRGHTDAFAYLKKIGMI
jgi:hypothetical protein